MTSKPISLLILGAGRLAVDVADMVADIEDVTVAGYVEGINRARCTSGRHGLPVHWIDDIASLAAGHKAVAAIGDPRRRAAILKVEKMGFEFVSLVHPTAHLARSVECGIGTVIAPGAVLAAAVVVGRHVFIGRGALIGHHTRIGDFSTIGPGVNISGDCSIGASSFIGIGATVINRVTLGANSFVAAGALITKSFPDGGRIGGAPARLMRGKAHEPAAVRGRNR